MTPSKALLWLCLSLISGVVVQSALKIPHSLLWGFLILGFLIIVGGLFLKKNSIALAGFCILFLLVGILRLQMSEFLVATSELRILNGQSEKITLSGFISAESDVRESVQRLIVDVKLGKVLITTRTYPEYHYLDQVTISGNLKTPEDIGDFKYANYLMKDGIYSVMDFPIIELISKEHQYTIFSFIYEKVLWLKSQLILGMKKNFSYPDHTIIEGVVFGNDKHMPKDLKDKFTAEGLNHITAVSGGNIVILISILTPLFLFLGLWRQQALWASLIIIWLYIILVGMPSSGVRAGIMGSIVLFAQIIGRQNTNSRTIILAATLMLLHNPFLLLSDAGFQLSFLASLGIIHIKPVIDHFIMKEPKKKSESKMYIFFQKRKRELLDIISVTLAAQLVTLPLIVFLFGRFSWVSLVTNSVILPIIPLLMIFGFLVSVFGIVSGFLGWIFALPCYGLIWYVTVMINLFYQPWIMIMVQSISLWWLILYYMLLIALFSYAQRKLQPSFLGS